ncbi:MAG: hypothetical protein AAFO69_10800 [Bacteroidota bacterium]
MNSIDQFDAYHRGEMSQEEAAGFEAQLKKDDDLKEEYALFLTSLETIADLKIKTEIASIVHQKETTALWIKIAASVFLFAVTLFVLTQIDIFSQQDYATLFEPYPDVVTVRNDRSDLREALSDYSSESFIEALKGLDKLKPSDTIYFYKAQCHLAMEQYHAAISNLHKIPENSVFIEQKNWYLGLSYLLINDKIKAKVEFSKIDQGEYQYDQVKLIDD